MGKFTPELLPPNERLFNTITKANKGKDTTGRLYPDLVVMMNLFDHLTTTGDYAAMLHPGTTPGTLWSCLLYTSDAADE